MDIDSIQPHEDDVALALGRRDLQIIRLSKQLTAAKAQIPEPNVPAENARPVRFPVDELMKRRKAEQAETDEEPPGA